MATFKETREVLLASYACGIITDEEFSLLFEENSSSNLDFPYDNYPPFNLESQSEAECMAKFRVEKHHIALVDVLQIPQFFVCDQGTVCEGTKGLCMLLKRYAFPCRYSDMILIYKHEEVLARTNTKKFSPFFQGPKFFNSLDNKVINSQSLSSFKKKLKIKLLSKYENSS